MLPTFLRVLIVYTMLILTMRFMGKRQIGELQLSELITTILLSEIASQPITDLSIPISFALVPIAVLLSLEVIISFAVTKSPFLKKVFDGKPSILIRRGKLDLQEIAKVRISLEELISSVRQSGIGGLSDVDYAILEQNGQLSVFPKKTALPPTADDLKLKTDESGIAHTVIVDTVVSDYGLQLIGRDRNWLRQRLHHHKVKLDDVFLFTVDDLGKEYLIKK